MFELNPHSVHTLNKHKEGIYAVALDNMNIVYTMNSEKTEIKVMKIIYVDNSSLEQQGPADKLRTKAWLERMNDIMEFRGEPEEKKE